MLKFIDVFSSWGRYPFFYLTHFAFRLSTWRAHCATPLRRV